MADEAESLPDGARAALGEYLAALDAALGPAVRGVYVTGSAALGDWQPGRSDLDILTVTAGPLGEAELGALEALHAAMPGRPYRDAVYAPAAAVGARPVPGAGAAGKFPAAVDGVFARDRHLPDPVLWATLDRHALTARGPAAGGLGADPGTGWLREWNRGNLDGYWRGWAAAVRGQTAGLEAGAPAHWPVTWAWLATWAALGPGRLHATIAAGEIISKTAAAGYTARLLPQYAELLGRAKAHRLGDDGQSFTVADVRAACGLIEAVADDAAALPD